METDDYLNMAGADGHELDPRIRTQNDFIWLLERKVEAGELTPLHAQLAFRDYSAYLDACEAAGIPIQ